MFLAATAWLVVSGRGSLWRAPDGTQGEAMDRWAQPVPLQRLADVPTWFDSFDSSGVPGAMPQVMEPCQAPRRKCG